MTTIKTKRQLRKPIRMFLNRVVEIIVFAIFTALFIVGFLQYFKFL